MQVARNTTGSIVSCQGIFFAIKGKFPILDPVAKAPDTRAKIWTVGQPSRQRLKPMGQISQDAIAVGCLHRHQNRPVLDDAGR